MQQLNLGVLSEREIEILDRAIEGMTDQQIGAAINISPSTVNSYWVRIRGKLGHLSRTELVSRILQQRALGENEGLRTKIAELESELAATRAVAWNSENAELLRVAFESHPEPTLILDDGAAVLLASEKACHFFGLSQREMAQCPLSRLINTNYRDGRGVSLLNQRVLERGGKVGLDYAIFAKARDGSSVRVFLILCPTCLGDKKILACIIRPFAEEIQIRQSRAAVVLADAS